MQHFIYNTSIWYICYWYSSMVFLNITFSLTILQDDVWCIGWQKNEAQTKNGKDMTLLGGTV